MKLRFILPSVIFAFCGLISHAQITRMYYQGFETSESTNYSVTPSGTSEVTSTIYASGERGMELTQSSSSDVTFMLDTLDFTQYTTQMYISLEFDHICQVPSNSGNNFKMCRIWWKRANQNENQWQALGSQEYNTIDGGSQQFTFIGAYNEMSYDGWNGTVSNSLWHSERFDLNQVITAANVASEKKIMIKFVMNRNTRTTGSAGKWFLDNVKISASPSPMVKPVITMLRYPEAMDFPSSRGARVQLRATTSVSAGINPDSVNLYYRVGSDPTINTLTMQAVPGQANVYATRIPFYGYDTLMQFYCKVCDATTNANRVTFPKSENAWVTYRCVRGGEQLGVLTDGFNGQYVFEQVPFPYWGDARNESVYDSALMADAGYSAGAITSLRFTHAAHNSSTTRPRLQIKMGNAPADYVVDVSNVAYIPYTYSYMQVVYDSVLTIPEANVDATYTINFQDTFFYAGKDAVMQITYDGDVDFSAATKVKMMSTVANKPTIYKNNSNASSNGQVFSNNYTADATSDRRPAVVFTEHKNQPLLYDMGISELVTPSYTVAMSERPGSIVVKLKNFGALTANAIRVSYMIDDTISGYYDWVGSLAGGAETNVTVTSNVNIPAGFHMLRVWVEDTLRAGTDYYRDHEPYNDTSFSEFIVCDGPMNGVRNIGGPNPHFNTIEEFLFSLSRCGIDDSLVVRLAPGFYPPFTMPVTEGISANHYIVFEPQGDSVFLLARTEWPSASIVNLEAISNVRFRNINFVRRDSQITDMVTLGINSANCRFEGCSFIDSLANPSAAMRIGAMINSGFANGLIVDGCRFVGGKVGVDLKGQASDILSQNNTVRYSRFENQFENAISAQNQNNVVVEHNEMYDVLSNNSFVLLANECYGTSKLTANKIYTSHGAGGLALGKGVGTASSRFIVANNMVVCEDDGNASIMRVPFNIIQATYADVVYNSVKMIAPNRNNISAAAFGGGTLSNSRFLNNVVVCLDGNNYALGYNPGSATTNTVGHNVYYSLGNTLNRKSGAAYASLTAWMVAEPSDSLSRVVNPNFLNGGLVDLRTYNRQVKGIGMPLTTVTTDMFDTLRSLTAPCPGAFEFASLSYDFEVEAMVNPPAETCHMPAQTELKLRMRNSGTMAYTGTGLTLSYRVNNNPIQNITITDPIPAEDTVTLNTGVMLSLPASGINDATYSIRVWTTFASDPNQTNDTNTFSVVSRYHPATPDAMAVTTDYATPAVITPTAGIDEWSVYNPASAPKRYSQIYWYRDSTDTDPFFVGNTLRTDTLRTDTAFYIRQRREQPIVRITQVEVAHANTTQGVTPSMPYWMATGRKVALQITNVGDAPACLYGDTIQMVSPNATLNNKIFTFGDSIWLQPGTALVVQYASGNSSNPAMTIHTGQTYNVSASSNVAFVYRRGGVIEDAVALNDIEANSTQAVKWATLGVPSYVWSGNGFTISMNTSAGLVRTSLDAGASAWRLATNASPMSIGTVDQTLIKYYDNGCEGGYAPVTVTLTNAPIVDIDLLTPVLPATGCGMGMEQVSVQIRNFGIQALTEPTLNYCAGGDTVSEVLTGTTIASNGGLYYTFTTPLNMAFSHDSVVTVKVWANADSGDPVQANDTSMATTTSLFTPAAPAALATRTVDYATRDTITHVPAEGLVPVWYDYDMTPVDTGNTCVTEILYVGGTMGMAYMVTNDKSGQVGDATTLNSKTSYPSPYQPKSKYAKQQFIYSASDLQSAGLGVGYINFIAFDLDSIYGNSDTVSFDEYSISLGMTADTVFGAANAWKTTQEVYYAAPMVIRRSNCDQWVTHNVSPFYWDGVSSLVVEVKHHIETPYNAGVQSRYTAKTNTALCKDGSTDMSEFTGSGNRGGNRPNIRFGNTVYGCSSPVTPFEVQMTNQPGVDMTVLWPAGVDTLDYNSCGNIGFDVHLRNQGLLEVTSAKLYYIMDTLPMDSTTFTGSIASGQTLNFTALSRQMMPGRHHLTVIVSATGDSITSNDTIFRAFEVKFCGGNYSIAADGDYPSFTAAIDTLNAVGIEGPVVFQVADGTYEEQVVLRAISGSSDVNTVSFVAVGDSAVLTASTSQNASIVFSLDSTANVSINGLIIDARPEANNVNYANALAIRKADNISVTGCTLRVKETINNANAACLVLDGYVTNLTLQNNLFDWGYYSVKSRGADFGYTNIIMNNNIMRNFWSGAVNMRGVTNIDISQNMIRGAVTVAGRGLTGIYLAQSTGTIGIGKNQIYLVDDRSGGKRGIQLENINCFSSNPGLIANNMISCSGTGTAGLTPQKPSGIWIDSSCTNVNILFNTVRVYCGPYANNTFSDASYAFYAGPTVSQIQCYNNIFSNFSKGYAYYVSELNTIPLSNFNGYYTESERPFAWKNTALANLAALQNTNTDDANSVFDEPYFVSDTNLHMVMTNFATLAQATTDVTDDIDGTMRSPLTPTIGAHEMFLSTHDMAVVRIVEPVMPANINSPLNIESDSARVIAQFYNNGQATETNVQWYAYIEGRETETRCPNQNLGTMMPGQTKLDTVMLPTPLGLIGEQNVRVVVLLPADTSLSDNERMAPIYLAPAFNIATIKVNTVSTDGCARRNTTIRLTLKNEGFKDIPAGAALKIGFMPVITSPATVTSVSTMPDSVIENVTLPSTLFTNTTTNIDFATNVNLYPSDSAVNLKIRLLGWCKYQYDVSPENDSTIKNSNTQSPIIDAYYIPDAPYGFDTTLAYGTWGEVRATQANSRPIRWYRDTTQAAFYHPTQYAASCKWSNTPQYFHDSTYYLNCYSDKNCPSAFSTVTVHCRSLYANDVAFVEALAPEGGRVYMENDTVRVRIANYGTQTQTNIPIAYELKRGNNVIQSVTETVPASLASTQEYVYTFNNLLEIPTPTATQNYSLTIWTNLANDAVRRNDTIRYAHTFRSLAESTYPTVRPGSPSFDVTRVSFNQIDLDIPPVGRGYTDLASYSSPEYAPLHVTRGLSDSLYLEVSTLEYQVQASRQRVWVYIDFDRNGSFSADEVVVDGPTFYDNEIFRAPITISNDASFGYMRMRIAVGSNADLADLTTAPPSGIPNDKDGHNLDFLLFVDANPPATDLAVSQMVTPRSYLVRNTDSLAFRVRLTNAGATPVSNPVIYYYFDDTELDTTGAPFVTYPGSIPAGTSVAIDLPSHSFPLGTTHLTVWHTLDGDADHANDTLRTEYHRFHEFELNLFDDFEGPEYWYAPVGNSAFSRNYWELGVPNKSSIPAAYSDSLAWVTDLDANIVSGKRGNVSYLYSPIINIAQIKSDTLSFRLRRNLSNKSSVHIEFYNYERRWEKLDLPPDSIHTPWYNNADDRCFDGNSSGTTYNYYVLPTKSILPDFNESLQFRFVYKTPIGGSNTAAYGGGCALDDFRINRSRQSYDVGCIAITEPANPQYGQTYYPSIKVSNFGLDTVTELTAGYTHYGTYLAKYTNFTNLSLAPGHDTVLTFNVPFTITHEYPEDFPITAFTQNENDIYRDNDTTLQFFHLTPLDNDIQAIEFVYPLEQVVAGDTAVQVTMRIRNFGAAEINDAQLSYIVNGVNRVDESIDFNQVLGRPLASMEYFNYAFTEKIHANMGMMKITGIVKSSTNDYIYNDTINKRVQGITSVIDLAATSVIVDTSGHTKVRIQVNIENRGARGVNGFEVGFYVDGDTSQIVREIYQRTYPLAALSTGYYMFQYELDSRIAPWDNVVAFVHVVGDNDPSNDTTNIIAPQFVDIEALSVVVEENAAPDCRVFLKYTNKGNVTVRSGTVIFSANINGTEVKKTTSRVMVPGDTMLFEFDRRIPKDPQRHYLGTGAVNAHYIGDIDSTNNQTSLVELFNYVPARWLPVPETSGIELGQNYPNPYSGQTTIPFTLPNDANVRFTIIDLMGHVVQRFDRFYAAGDHALTIDMAAFPTGIYYYSIEVNGERRMKKMILR
jgi:hypothetical protein